MSRTRSLTDAIRSDCYLAERPAHGAASAARSSSVRSSFGFGDAA